MSANGSFGFLAAYNNYILRFYKMFASYVGLPDSIKKMTLAWQGYYPFTETTMETTRHSPCVFDPWIHRFMCGLVTELSPISSTSSCHPPFGASGNQRPLFSWKAAGVPPHFLDLCGPIWQPRATCGCQYSALRLTSHFSCAQQKHVATIVGSTDIKHSHHCRKFY